MFFKHTAWPSQKKSCLLKGKLSSILLGPESPTLVREDFRHSLAAGVAVIFFDFDGTLTATPGDRAARRTKQLELCERAPMLAPRLKSLCADGASLGIISKSTETCRDWSPSGRDCQVQKKFFAAFCAAFHLRSKKTLTAFQSDSEWICDSHRFKCFREYRGIIVVHLPS